MQKVYDGIAFKILIEIVINVNSSGLRLFEETIEGLQEVPPNRSAF